MEAKERKMGLKKAAVLFKCTAFAVFQIHFSQRMLLQAEIKPMTGLSGTTDFLKETCTILTSIA